MKTIKLFLATTALSVTGMLTGQTNSIIKGTVVNEKGEPMLFVPVGILQDTTIIASTLTDVNGEFTVKEMVPGNYNVKAVCVGYDIQLLKAVKAHLNQTAYVNISMTPSTNLLKQVVVSASYHEPIIKPVFSTVTSIAIDQIENSATGKSDIIGMITMMTPAVLPTPDGKDIYVRGSRQGSTGYYVDGNRTMNVPEVPGMGIASMEVLTGGVPAEYGDCTGGLVIVTTKEYKWEMSRKKIETDARKEAEIAKPKNK